MLLHEQHYKSSDLPQKKKKSSDRSIFFKQ